MRWLAIALVVVVGCGDTQTETQASTTQAPAAAVSEGCADVVEATAQRQSDGTWTFSVTVSSADTGWDKYADIWEVRSRDGEVLGARVLTHPHETEQPFTRSLAGVEIPAGESDVVIAAGDSVLGFCGQELTLALQA